ncbi:SH3 domain-containing protein [Streptomyces sp. OF3]|uniref:SH3 domain-containing protein n=1 Tax=Streptomyces alkaliterrae TaxID=2213162 RepID=A0A7W3ZL59_9ACTN|nr:SH3 domain-containing protein [Streptomyces alkaliterrae]MBB1252534.1 SH3 domain-containing protein [Streptomyces alkaliterrae]
MSAPSALAAPALSAPALSASASDEFNRCGYHPKGATHLRTGPGKKYASIGMLYPDDDLHADKKKNGWYRVQVSGKSQSGLKANTRGWVAKSQLKRHICTILH